MKKSILLTVLSLAMWNQQTLAQGKWEHFRLTEADTHWCAVIANHGTQSVVVAIAEGYKAGGLGSDGYYPGTHILRKSNDGGKTWHFVTHVYGKLNYWEKMAHPAPERLVVLGWSDSLQEYFTSTSKDTGHTWAHRPTGIKDDVFGYYRIKMAFYGSRGVFSVPPSSSFPLPRFFVTNDYGESWTEADFPKEIKEARDLHLYGENKVAVLDERNRKIWYSDDFLASGTWETTDFPEDETLIPEHEVSFVGDSHIFFVSYVSIAPPSHYRTRIYGTANRGKTWEILQEIDPSLPNLWIFVNFASPTHGVALPLVTMTRFSLHTTDGGLTWSNGEFPEGSFSPPFAFLYEIDTLSGEPLLLGLSSKSVFLYDFAPAGLEEVPQSKSSIALYPNPANNQVSISLPETFGSGHCQLAIYDMQGRLAGQQTVIATPGQPIPYSTAHLPNGLYMVRIGMGEKTAGGRLVVGR